MKGKIMNSQTSTQQTKAQPNKKTANSAENDSVMKRLLKIKTYCRFSCDVIIFQNKKLPILLQF